MEAVQQHGGRNMVGRMSQRGLHPLWLYEQQHGGRNMSGRILPKDTGPKTELASSNMLRLIGKDQPKETEPKTQLASSNMLGGISQKNTEPNTQLASCNMFVRTSQKAQNRSFGPKTQLASREAEDRWQQQ
jgi:hypothetical protein